MKFKKENTQVVFKYLLFLGKERNLFGEGCIDFKRNLIDGNLVREFVWRQFDVAVFTVKGVSPGKGLMIFGWQSVI